MTTLAAVGHASFCASDHPDGQLCYGSRYADAYVDVGVAGGPGHTNHLFLCGALFSAAAAAELGTGLESIWPSANASVQSDLDPDTEREHMSWCPGGDHDMCASRVFAGQLTTVDLLGQPGVQLQVTVTAAETQSSATFPAWSIPEVLDTMAALAAELGQGTLAAELSGADAGQDLGERFDPTDPIRLYCRSTAARQSVCGFEDPGAEFLPAPGRGVAIRDLGWMDSPIDEPSDLDESMRLPNGSAVLAVDALRNAAAAAAAVDAAAASADPDTESLSSLVLLGAWQAGPLNVAAYLDTGGIWEDEPSTFVAFTDNEIDWEDTYQIVNSLDDKFRIITPQESLDLAAAIDAAVRGRPPVKTGVPRRDDKLRLDGRIDLAAGERLIRSSRIPLAGESYYDNPTVMAAVIDTPAGRIMKLVLFNGEEWEEKQWLAADDGDAVVVLTQAGLDQLTETATGFAAVAQANRARLAELIGPLDAQVADLENELGTIQSQTVDVGLTEQQQAEHDELIAKLDAMKTLTTVGDFYRLHREYSAMTRRRIEYDEETGRPGYMRPPTDEERAEEEAMCARIGALRDLPEVVVAEETSSKAWEIDRLRYVDKLTDAEEARKTEIEAEIRELWRQWPPDVEDCLGKTVVSGVGACDLVVSVHGQDVECEVSEVPNRWRIEMYPWPKGVELPEYGRRDDLDLDLESGQWRPFLRNLAKLMAA